MTSKIVNENILNVLDTICIPKKNGSMCVNQEYPITTVELLYDNNTNKMSYKNEGVVTPICSSINTQSVNSDVSFQISNSSNYVDLPSTSVTANGTGNHIILFNCDCRGASLSNLVYLIININGVNIQSTERLVTPYQLAVSMIYRGNITSGNVVKIRVKGQNNSIVCSRQIILIRE